MYVALEGIDTAGKSTQIGLLKERFAQALFTKEPGGTPLGAKLREILLGGEVQSERAELLLFLSDRAEHMERVVKPALARGEWVFSDRSLISGMAYARGFEMSWLEEINRFALGGIVPDCVVLLELSEEELARRLAQKERDSIESRGIPYLLELQERLKRASETLAIPTLRLSASLPPQEIHQRIIAHLRGS